MISENLRSYAAEHFQRREASLAPLMPRIMEGLASCTPEEDTLMRFFYGTMPLRDAAEYPFSTFLSYVRHALWLREHVEWCRSLPEEIFVHHVLYYRINSEDISECRSFFYEQLKDRIAGMTQKEAVLEINYWCAEHAVYQSTDGRTASPMTMYRCGKGRCGEESTFAAAALRSVGIAARQVYTPRWAHCDDNHAWTEVYLDGEWHFLGACEPEEELNRGWFVGPAGRAVLIHSRTFGDFAAGGQEELIGREGLMVYHNHTASYTRAEAFTICVTDEEGRPAADAEAAVEVLNMAEYYPAAVLRTDAAGEASITLGLGDIRVRAFKDGMAAEGRAEVGKDSRIRLRLSRPEEVWRTEDVWTEDFVRAPREHVVREGKLTDEQEKTGAKRLAEANRLREERFAAIGREEIAAHPEEEEALHIAGENASEIAAFLERDDNPDRKKLLHSLTPKDDKDLKADVLEDHLSASQGELPEEIYVPYLLCPRVLLEELRPYRSFIRAFFTKEQKEAFSTEPDRIWDYIQENIRYDEKEEYGTICATPVGCLQSGQGSLTARKILFAAICRTLNLPARVEVSTMLAQYWKDGEWHVPSGAKEDRPADRGCTLTLSRRAESKWNYYQNWTLGRLEGTCFVTMDYEGLSFADETLCLTLEAGVYRLIKTMRLPSGDQHTAYRIFALQEGENKQIDLTGWVNSKETLTQNCGLGDICLCDEEKNTWRLDELTKEQGCILAFLGVGAEPTEHVLNELLECEKVWNETGCRLMAVLRDSEDLSNRTLQKVLGRLSGIRLFYGGAESCRSVAERMGTDASRLPVLAAVEPGGVGIYGCSGYNVGSVELMRKLLAE